MDGTLMTKSIVFMQPLVQPNGLISADYPLPKEVAGWCSASTEDQQDLQKRRTGECGLCATLHSFPKTFLGETAFLGAS